MIRAVLDTNVLVSGFAGFHSSDSTPGEILHLWRDAAFVLVVSNIVLNEFERTLRKPYYQARFIEQQIVEALELLNTESHLALLTTEVHGIATHPEDDLVLAAAISGSADYLVTGDKGLLAVGVYAGVTIVTPRAFLDILHGAGEI